MRINKQSNYNRQNNEDYIKDADNDLTNVFFMSQGRVRFGNGTTNTPGENISGGFVVFTSSATANAEDIVAHGLSSTPVGYIVINKDKAGVLYSSTTTANTTNIYFKSDTATTEYSVFVLK